MESYVSRAETVSPGRAGRLFDSLCQRYGSFAEQLPTPVRDYALVRSTYAGHRDDSVFDGVGWMNPVLSGTPWLFWELFQRLDDEEFLLVAEAGMFLVLASVIQDHSVDNQNQEPESASLLHQALYSQAVWVYGLVFPHPDPFWNHFQRLENDHLRGLAKELEARKNPAALSEEGLAISAHGKVSPIVTTISALCLASQQPDLLDPIERSLKHIAVASQLLDDTGDWFDDLKVKHLTYFLAQIGSAENWLNEEWPPAVEIQKEIDKNWLDVISLGKVKSGLEASLQAVAHIECPGWKAYVQEYWDLADQNQLPLFARHLAQTLEPLIGNDEIN